MSTPFTRKNDWGIFPNLRRVGEYSPIKWWAVWDSNPQPTLYENAALPIELTARNGSP